MRIIVSVLEVCVQNKLERKKKTDSIDTNDVVFVCCIGLWYMGTPPVYTDNYFVS